MTSSGVILKATLLPRAFSLSKAMVYTSNHAKTAVSCRLVPQLAEHLVGVLASSAAEEEVSHTGTHVSHNGIHVRCNSTLNASSRFVPTRSAFHFDVAMIVFIIDVRTSGATSESKNNLFKNDLTNTNYTHIDLRLETYARSGSSERQFCRLQVTRETTETAPLTSSGLLLRKGHGYCVIVYNIIRCWLSGLCDMLVAHGEDGTMQMPAFARVPGPLRRHVAESLVLQSRLCRV